MDKLEAITTQLGRQESETLEFFVNIARSCGSQHLAWILAPGGKVRLVDCDKTFNYNEFEDRRGSMEALATLGFASYRRVAAPLNLVGTDYLEHLTLLSAAFDRSAYNQKNKLQRWRARTYLQYKEFMVVVAFFLSLALAAIEIIKFLKPAP